MFIDRALTPILRRRLKDFPAVALLGPRQCGKSTLAQAILKKSDAYLDLEKPSDLAKIQDPEEYLRLHKNTLICLDEIQRKPELFAVLRGFLDSDKKNGQVLILGSASPQLIKHSSETLAGRISYLELTPLLLPEVRQSRSVQEAMLKRLWLCGGFPRSFLARSNDASFQWREDFIRNFLERDIPQLGIRIPAETLRRFWLMCAHSHGQILNTLQIGQSLGLSHTTIRSYVDILSQAFVLRVLPPYLPNLKKRLIKSPKIYVRDCGLLHALLGLRTKDDSMGHPVYGASWEGFVLENVAGVLKNRWQMGFYRTSDGNEMDLVLEQGNKRYGIECKVSSAPTVGKGFYNAINDLRLQKTFIVAPVSGKFPIGKNINIIGLCELLAELQAER